MRRQFSPVKTGELGAPSLRQRRLSSDAGSDEPAPSCCLSGGAGGAVARARADPAPVLPTAPEIVTGATLVMTPQRQHRPRWSTISSSDARLEVYLRPGDCAYRCREDITCEPTYLLIFDIVSDF